MFWVADRLAQFTREDPSPRDIHQLVVSGERLAVANDPLVPFDFQIASRELGYHACEVNAPRSVLGREADQVVMRSLRF